MLYKVLLVEDEIVTREGIRDNVDWESARFEFCGEASDGEIALPLIEITQPDVLITDIKMPFMDGLQLCKLVRERMPEVKIIIFSGHDEFHYAQEAVKLGVTEYLLKPVGAQDLLKVLRKVASQLDQEREEKEKLKRLQDQIEDNLALLKEKFLLKLVTGGGSSLEVIEESQRLGLDIVAKWYLVIVIKAELHHSAEPFDYSEYQHVERTVSSLVGRNPDIFLIKKNLEELVLIIKGDQAEHLEQEGYFLTALIKNEVEGKTQCWLTIGMGRPHNRIGDIQASFAEALINTKRMAREKQITPGSRTDNAALLKLDKAAVENYLKFGMKEDFENFFATYIQFLGEVALQSYLIKNYIFIDVVLTTAKFVKELGGNIDEVIPEINNVEALLMNIKTIDQIKEETQKIFASAFTFRDRQTHNQYALIIHQAKAYIACHYSDPDLSLNELAAQVNLSPSHFSTVFSRETGQTFKEYLIRLRIDRAKELLRTTSLRAFEVAYQSGYNDPHYFSYIFRKNTGLTPQQFRLQPQTEKE